MTQMSRRAKCQVREDAGSAPTVVMPEQPSSRPRGASVGESRERATLTQELVQFDAVLVLRVTRDALFCAIGGNRMWVSRDHMELGSDLSKKGDIGRLVIPRWVAMDLEMSNKADAVPDPVDTSSYSESVVWFVPPETIPTAVK